MRTANYSELRANMKHYLDGVIRDNEPLVVHRQGSESVVIMSLEDYNSMAETEYLMRSPAMIDAIRQGENDIEVKVNNDPQSSIWLFFAVNIETLTLCPGSKSVLPGLIT